MKAYKPYYHQARRQEHIARVSDEELIQNLEEVVVLEYAFLCLTRQRQVEHGCGRILT